MFEQVFTEKEKNKLIKAESDRMTKLFKNKLNKDKYALALRLIENSAFLFVTLKEAKRIVNRDGIIETYQNGQNQHGQKKSSAMEIYDKSFNTYMKLIKQLTDLLPEELKEDIADAMKQDIENNKKI